MDINPYQAPAADVVDQPAPSDAMIALREQHLRHEVQLKSVGSLYFLGGLMLALGAFGMLASTSVGTQPLDPERASVFRALGFIYIGLSAASFVLAAGFRRLRSWVRIPGGIMSILGLLAIPIGTLVNIWILYLMFGKAGRVVLAPEYQDVIAATPQVRYRRSVGDWIAVGLVVLLFVLLLVMVVVSQFRS